MGGFGGLQGPLAGRGCSGPSPMGVHSHFSEISGPGPPHASRVSLVMQGAISQIFDVLGPTCLVGGHFGLGNMLGIMTAMVFRDEFSHGLEKRFRVEIW